MNAHIKIIDIIQSIFKEKNQDFITKLYLQIYNRVPKLSELNEGINKLKTDHGKIKMIADLIGSKEAVHLYPNLEQKSKEDRVPTISSILQQKVDLTNIEYIQFLYEHILNRLPNQEEEALYMNLLKKGISRIRLIQSFFLSEEFQLIMNQSPFEEQNDKQKKNIVIGVFLGFRDNVGAVFEREGIGRFVIRLVHAMLTNVENVTIHIYTNHLNYDSIKRTFIKYQQLHPAKIDIFLYQTIDDLNKNNFVDVWLVPYIGMEFAMDLQKPIILVLHDLVYKHFDIYKKLYPEFCAKLDSIIYELANKATAVVSSSNYVRKMDSLELLKLPEEKTHVIRLAPPVEEYKSFKLYKENTFKKKYHLKNNYFIYPSVIRLHKNHLRLIEAFFKFITSEEGKHSNLDLVFTDNYKYNPLEKEIAKLLDSNEMLKKRVVFLGRIPSSDLPSLYKYAEGTIIPTLFEGSCPFQIFESLVVGTPVAMSNIEVMREVIINMNSFITFDPYSVDEMEKSILQLWRDKNLLIEKQKNASVKIFEREWSHVAIEYYSLVKKVTMSV